MRITQARGVIGKVLVEISTLAEGESASPLAASEASAFDHVPKCTGARALSLAIQVQGFVARCYRHVRHDCFCGRVVWRSRESGGRELAASVGVVQSNDRCQCRSVAIMSGGNDSSANGR